MGRLLPLTVIGSSACTVMELYHYRCKNTLGVWGQSPHVLAQQFLYHNNATGWLTFSGIIVTNGLVYL